MTNRLDRCLCNEKSRDQVEYDEDRDDERDKRGEQDGTRNS